MHILFNPGTPEVSRNFYLHMYRPRTAVMSEDARAAGSRCCSLSAEHTSQTPNLKTMLRNPLGKSPEKEVHKKGHVKAREGQGSGENHFIPGTTVEVVVTCLVCRISVHSSASAGRLPWVVKTGWLLSSVSSLLNILPRGSQWYILKNVKSDHFLPLRTLQHLGGGRMGV